MNGGLARRDFTGATERERLGPVGVWLAVDMFTPSPDGNGGRYDGSKSCT
ncbi:hypothetical protein [Amycolatopsis sp. NPDC057786]